MLFASLQPEQVLTRFLGARERTRELFDLLAPEAFDRQPIPLRHPIRFYEGHLAAFNANVLYDSGYLRAQPVPSFSGLFARGIDPDNPAEAASLQIQQWPDRQLVKSYVAGVDDIMVEAIRRGGLYERLLTCIEHEEMHQETLVYLIHQLPHELKHPPASAAPDLRAPADTKQLLPIPGGPVRLGAVPHEVPFGWDNEFPAVTVNVADFRMESHKVTNEDFLAFVEAGGYTQDQWWEPAHRELLREANITAPAFWFLHEGEWYYRGLFDSFPLPPRWPVYVSYAEALAYARWKGMRLPTEAEFQRAAYPDGQALPDGQADAVLDHTGANVDFRAWNCRPIGREGEPRNTYGLAEMVGNGWEWTATPFAGFPGFAPRPHYPGYSADFFDDRHFVVKGGSPVTAAALTRPGFRNWYRDHYRYAYTSFRCVTDGGRDAGGAVRI